MYRAQLGLRVTRTTRYRRNCIQLDTYPNTELYRTALRIPLYTPPLHREIHCVYKHTPDPCRVSLPILKYLQHMLV